MTCPRRPSRSLEDQMRGIISCLIAVCLFACNPAWAAAGEDDRNERSNEKSNPAAEKKPSETAKSGTTAAPNPAIESELQQLRQLVQEQAERLHGLQQRLADVEGELAAGKSAPTNAASSATSAVQPAPPAESAASSAPPAARQRNDGDQEKKPSPLYFEIGKAKFTPGGFVDFTSITRSTNLGSGIATSFGAIPYSNTTQGRLSEFHFSAQYSRLSLKVDAPVTDSTSLTGYVETDFLGYQPANAYVTANSNSLRMRLFWAQIKHGKWDVLGGQEWSLLTPNRVGLSPLTSDLFLRLLRTRTFRWASRGRARRSSA